jgi:protease I
VPFQALTALGHSVHAGEKRQLLAAARRVSACATCAPEMRLAGGGEYVETPPDGAIRDGNLVSGFAWPAHPQFLALFLEVLGTRVSL